MEQRRLAGLRVAERIDAGQVSVNGGPLSIEAPFGGFKQSGHGREKGLEALREYAQTTTISLSLVDGEESTMSPDERLDAARWGALAGPSPERDRCWAVSTVGVVGLGNIGSVLASQLGRIGP